MPLPVWSSQAAKQRLQNKGTVTGAGAASAAGAAAAAAAAALASITGRKRPAEGSPVGDEGQEGKDAAAGAPEAPAKAEPMDEGA